MRGVGGADLLQDRWRNRGDIGDELLQLFAGEGPDGELDPLRLDCGDRLLGIEIAVHREHAAVPEHGFQHAGRTTVVEYAPALIRENRDLWRLDASPHGTDSFAIMKKVKQMFDPNGLLNRSRLYGRI